MSRNQPNSLDPDLAPLIPAYLTARRADLQALRGYLDAGEFKAIEAVGHQMRGSGGTYGFVALSQLGGALEEAAAARDAGTVTHLLARMASWLDAQP